MNKKQKHDLDLAKALKANLLRRKADRGQNNSSDKQDIKENAKSTSDTSAASSANTG